jgi:hypothetical protein
MGVDGAAVKVRHLPVSEERKMHPDAERLSVYLSPQDAARVRAIAARHRMGVNAALIRAVKLLDHAECAWDSGGQILVQRENGTRELVPV